MSIIGLPVTRPQQKSFKYYSSQHIAIIKHTFANVF